MLIRRRQMCASFILLAIMFIACSQNSASTEDRPAPAKVEPVPGTILIRVILSPKAAERLGVETAPVLDARAAGVAITTTASGVPLTVVPYSSVIYDPDGRIWVYTNPEPLKFIRSRIEVAYISGDQAVLLAGPPVDSTVVSVGAAELFGIEFGVGK